MYRSLVLRSSARAASSPALRRGRVSLKRSEATQQGPAAKSGRNLDSLTAPPRASEAPQPLTGRDIGRGVRREPKHQPKMDFKSISPHLPRGMAAAVLCDTAVWAGAVTLVAGLGLLDLSYYAAIVKSYPLHSLFPESYGIRGLAVISSSSLLWSMLHIHWRLPYLCFVGYVIAARIHKSEVTSKRSEFHVAVAEVFPTDCRERHWGILFEMFAFSVATFLVLTFFDAGAAIRHKLPEDFVAYLTSFNSTLRAYVGTNDWPTDDQLTCATIALVSCELYVMARTRALYIFYRLISTVTK
ncbi:hypothetical protein DIPPA_70184 [Diplonema papillatum]|nr:hypothetical protein DIPPA_70184 [Diplonema papillatum]